MTTVARDAGSGKKNNNNQTMTAKAWAAAGRRRGVAAVLAAWAAHRSTVSMFMSITEVDWG